MNHSTTLRAMRIPSSRLCAGSVHSTFLLSSIARTATPYHRLASSVATGSTPSSSPSPPVPSAKVNPPASTRPAPLDLPERQPDSSKIGHLIATGKAYIKFYKTGLKAVFSNRRLIQNVIAEKSASVEGFRSPSVFTPGVIPKGFSRADWMLLWRVRHDVLRVPLFGLVLLVCGEFTPLIVIFVDGVVPYTCRLPKQIESSFKQAEERRQNSFLEFEKAAPQGVVPGMARAAARKHVLRSLHVPGMMWEKLGFFPPGLWATKGRLRMAFLEGDDRLLARDGGAAGLEEQEVRIACTERGIDCSGRDDAELRQLLDEWLRLVDAEEAEERRKRMTVLLTTKLEKWPKDRNFELPKWQL
ncbi:Letm1-like protein [Colletotrichum higginsianum IMI 349063]|uniref:Letm1-like protein n=3 Tax=Colletotrichum higginsianum TaxID=80884 RepID=A0A1B7Y5R5_COLHI|nr:Letm1-like protein [Colletotrichum higginsianum IMI 349063]OBR07380.1 Letm1-like protein [Colletotrichum higginsianum IMI 349063]